CYEWSYNIVRYMTNGPVCDNHVNFHDNLFEYITESYDGMSHGNVKEGIGTVAVTTQYMYNNVFRHNAVGVHNWPDLVAGVTAYYFNNIQYDTGGATGNCWLFDGTTGTVYIFNNTPTQSCSIRLPATQGFAGTM